MSATLRPLSTGELLDRTFTLYRKNFQLFFGISILPLVAVLLVGVVQDVVILRMPGEGFNRPRMIAFGAIGFIVLIVSFMAAAFAQAAGVKAISAVHLEQPITIAQAFSGVGKRLGRVFNVILSVAIRSFGPMLLWFAVTFAGSFAMASAAPGDSSFAFMGFIVLFFALAFIPTFIWVLALMAKYSVAVPACVVEDVKARQAMKRSVVLTKGSLRRALVIYFVLLIVYLSILFGLQVPAQLLAQSAIGAGANPMVAAILVQVVSFLALGLATPILAIGISLLYYDQRVRKEAFDIEWMMREAGSGTEPPITATALG